MSPDAPDWLARLTDPADRGATADFYAAWLPRLVEHLAGLGLTRDDAHILDGAERAITDFVKNPVAYKPDRSSLDYYLCMAAGRDLRNVLARERRHAASRDKGVELDELAGKEPTEAPERFDDHPELVAVRDGLSDADRAVLDLILAGAKATSEFVGVVGAEGLPPAEQEKVVNRAKDRVKKQLVRAVRPPEGP